MSMASTAARDCKKTHRSLGNPACILGICQAPAPSPQHSVEGQGDGGQDPWKHQGAASFAHGCQDESTAGHAGGQELEGLQGQDVQPA